MVEVFNVLSTVLAFAVSIYLFFASNRTTGGLRTGFMLLSLGVFIALGIHSLAEFLEAFGYLDVEILTTVMPVLVFIGSVFLMLGTYTLYSTIEKVSSER